MRLFLCRHGETNANYTHVLQGSGIDQPLNERGFQQAHLLADRLSLLETKPKLVISSQLQRAQQTAKIIADKLECPLHTESNLAELSWGSWDGKRKSIYGDGLLQIHRRWNDGDFDAKTPSGESPVEAIERALPVIQKYMWDGNVCIVAHGRLLRILMSHLFHGTLQTMNQFKHHNTCLNILDLVPLNTPTKVWPDALSDQTHCIELNNSATKTNRFEWKHPISNVPHVFNAVTLDNCTHLPSDLYNV